MWTEVYCPPQGEAEDTEEDRVAAGECEEPESEQVHVSMATPEPAVMATQELGQIPAVIATEELGQEPAVMATEERVEARKSVDSGTVQVLSRSWAWILKKFFLM